MNRTRSIETRRIRCQVVETSADPGVQEARDLLPWADPYIASLMESLAQEQRELEPRAPVEPLELCRPR